MMIAAAGGVERGRGRWLALHPGVTKVHGNPPGNKAQDTQRGQVELCSYSLKYPQKSQRAHKYSVKNQKDNECGPEIYKNTIKHPP